MEIDRTETGDTGLTRALRLIYEQRSWHRDTPGNFARIIVGMFPAWFEFESGQFAVLSWERGLKLVVSGTEGELAIFTTSDSRCMSCIYIGQGVDQARMDMHYHPFPDQAERAQMVIGLALHRLFPERGSMPIPAGVVVPAGRVFPPEWGDSPPAAEPVAATDHSRVSGFWRFITRLLGRGE